MSPQGLAPPAKVSIPDTRSLRVGARLQKQRSKWTDLPMPRWVWRTLKEGFRFRFLREPYQSRPPFQPRLSMLDASLVDQEIALMLAHGACRDVSDRPSPQGEFLLSLFVVHQGQKSRVVFNFPPLNEFCEAPHFKMESARVAQTSILPNDYAMKGDFTKAYWGLAIHPQHRKYCRFIWRGRKYELLVLSFGASVAPYLFDAVMNVAIRALRDKGLRLVYYLDDWLLLHQDRDTCIAQAQRAVDLFSSLGFVVHPTKTDKVPTQVFDFLGVGFDTVRNLMFVPPKKQRDIRREANKILASPSCTPRRLASLLGKIVFSAQVSLESRLHLSRIEWTKCAWLKSNPSWDAHHQLPEDARGEIQWWSRLAHRLSPAWIHPPGQATSPPGTQARVDGGLPLGVPCSPIVIRWLACGLRRRLWRRRT